MDYRPAASGDHRRQYLFAQEELALQVQVEHRLEGVLVTPVQQIGGLVCAASVVHEHPNVPELLDGRVDEVLYRRPVCDVTFDRNNAAIVCVGQLRRNRFDVLVSARADDDVATRFGEPGRDLAPDTSRRSSHNGWPVR